jgi:hypothetical protein
MVGQTVCPGSSELGAESNTRMRRERGAGIDGAIAQFVSHARTPPDIPLRLRDVSPHLGRQS